MMNDPAERITPTTLSTTDWVAALEADDADTVRAALAAQPARVNRFINQPTDAGDQMWMPMHFAAAAGADAVVAVLLEHGVSPQCRTRFAVPTQARATPLHLATQHGHRAVVERLIKAGAEVDVLDARLDRPLHLAARHGQAGLIEMLARHGAALDPRNTNDRTPLHEAIRSTEGVTDEDANDTAIALIDAGADREAVCAKEPEAATPAMRCRALAGPRLTVLQALGSSG